MAKVDFKRAWNKITGRKPKPTFARYRPNPNIKADIRAKTVAHMSGIRWASVKLPKYNYSKLIAILIIGGAVYAAFGTNLFVLTELKITGNHLVETDAIKAAVFPKGFKSVNALTFSEGRVKRRLNVINQISEVNITKNLISDTLTIALKEHQTSIIWVTAGERYLVNRFGVVYDRAEEGSPLLAVEDAKNVAVSVNQQIVTPEFIDFVTSFVANLPRRTDITVRTIKVPETTFEIEMITADNWRIILDTTQSYETQLNNLVRVLKQLDGKPPREYVDLRIRDKVFFK